MEYIAEHGNRINRYADEIDIGLDANLANRVYFQLAGHDNAGGNPADIGNRIIHRQTDTGSGSIIGLRESFSLSCWDRENGALVLPIL